MFPLSVSDAEDLMTPAIDQTVEDIHSGDPGTNLKQDSNAILLKLMSSLCQKIERLDSGIERGNTAIIQALQTTKTRPPSKPGILRPPSFDATTVDEDTTVSSVARNHARATRNEETPYEEVEEENEEDGGEEEDN